MSLSKLVASVLLAMSATAAVGLASASDHLDSPAVIADARVDIGDVYAWMSGDAGRLNLVMTIVGHTFSDRADYVFHIDSGAAFGKTSATSTVTCRLPQAGQTQCRIDDADVADGDASNVEGLVGRKRGLRVMAGLRDDPLFNNVKGTRAAYQVAARALHAGATSDTGGCPNFSEDTAREVLRQWQHTDGGPARDFLEGWTPASIVVTVDRKLVAKGGDMLAVWGATVVSGRQVDRAARPLTGNALLGTIAPDDESDLLKELYNAETPEKGAVFVPEIEKGLAFYDGLDGHCGNQWLATAAPKRRYVALATLLADDRLWVNSASGTCRQFMAVELANVAGQARFAKDCGGRTPTQDSANIYRSLLVSGTLDGIDDGLHRDALTHSDSAFPFLAAPAPKAGASSGAYGDR